MGRFTLCREALVEHDLSREIAGRSLTHVIYVKTGIYLQLKKLHDLDAIPPRRATGDISKLRPGQVIGSSHY